MDTDTRYEVKDSIATITLARPEKRNALTVQMRVDLTEYFERAGADRDVRVVLLRAEGPGFCAGADVGAMSDLTLPETRHRMQLVHRLMLNLHYIDKPVICAVRGHCVGLGFSLALACDHIIASPTAKFGMVFKKLGLAPDGGALYFLARSLGVARAKELIFSARMLEAAEAQSIGLVQRVVPDDQLDAAAADWAREYASGPTYALGLGKRLFDTANSPSLETFLQTEQLTQAHLTGTHDHKEGVAAFREKRTAKFLGC
ncbi:enoyl-CoA hydratase/isomerase family protein [Ramlibacter sp.]|uniref:enoyl-CoA hydratase/isomerase family protein n=1 Tax=Ramlibacter sp. TaxID=1917967 RepID=UPI003D12D7AB